MQEGINNFAKYFMELILNMWGQIKSFFVSLFNIFKSILVTNHVDNFTIISKYQENFNVISWILFVLIDGLVVAFLILLVIKIVQLCRRWFKFRKKEVDKEDLLFEIAALKKQVDILTKEKERILSLAIGGNAGPGGALDNFGPSLVNETDMFGSGSFNGDININMPSQEQEKVEVDNNGNVVENRFAKLALVDQKYKNGSFVVNMAKEDMIGLPEIVARFVNFSASQHHLYYTKKTISKFIAGLATTKIIILEGISGTGKTSLPYCFSRFLKNQAEIVSVQPSWRDRTEILGYLNEFTKKFNETDFLKALYEVSYRNDINFVVLDEMNLARIEYYFAEFLSVMEMPDTSEWKIDLVPTQLANDPKHLVDGKLLIPQNAWYIGTANKDDSTFTITDKVYDRAVTLYLNERAQYFDAPFTEALNCSYDYIEGLFEEADKNHQISLKNMQNIDKIDEYIQDNFKVAFGNRILKQIKKFVPVYVACGNTELEGLDYMISTKIFKKFEALNLPFLRKELEGLIALLQKLFGKDAFKESINYLNDLLKLAS